MTATIPTGNGNIIRETAKAILWEAAFGQIWLPKSQINYEFNAEGMGYVEMPEWLYRKNRMVIRGF